jgi:CubicO group peptidase (beta-lactamase class C family)
MGEAKGTADVETSHLGYLRVKSGSATPERPIVRRIFWQVAASCLLATAGLLPISALADDDLIANQLAAYLEQEAGHLSGVLLVAEGNQILFQGAYGKASIAFDRNNEIDTKFNVASVGKMFTSVAIVQLAERGLISYTDPIAKYLPNYPNPAVASSITIGQLLTDTSGMVDLFDSQFFNAAKNLFVNVTDYFPLITSYALQFPPGAHFSYTRARLPVVVIQPPRICSRFLWRLANSNC